MKTKLLIAILMILSICFSECKKNTPYDFDNDCKIEGRVTKDESPISGVKVTFETASKNPQKYKAITDMDGNFEIESMLPGLYNFKIEKENYSLYMYKDDDDICPPLKINRIWNTIELYNNITKRLNIYLTGNNYYGGGHILVTYYDTDSLIEPRIYLDNGMSILNIKIYNGTTDAYTWNCSIGRDAYVYGRNDTIEYGEYGNEYHLITDYYEYPIFTGISQKTGTLRPGEEKIVSFYINPQIYTLDYYGSGYSSSYHANDAISICDKNKTIIVSH